MKKIVLLSFLISSFTATFAKIITVQVVNFQFMPSTVNAKVGDTIRWVWKQGTHTTTSLTIPAGALAWNKPIDINHRVFRYKLTKAGTYKYRCNIHASIMKGTINVTARLAADLNSFSVADDEEAKALLNWKTGSSKDLAYFSVQRSTDGENFKEIGRLSPNQLSQYKFTDNDNISGKYVYYQVDMIDTRGYHQLSEIQMFTRKSKAAKLITSFSPNPISRPGHLMLQFNADNDGKMLVQLYNQAGVFLTQTEMTATKGLNNGHFHLGDLAPGTYYIVCTLGTLKEKHTIIVR
jgi:plastocyanin